MTTVEDVLAVECTVCAAKPGQVCVVGKGRRKGETLSSTWWGRTHVTRRREPWAADSEPTVVVER